VSWHGGKGSGKRKQQVSEEVMQLRWELWQPGTSLERKKEIAEELERIERKKG
jgi:hypothetical protein